jgi:hypothetical protein
MLTALPKRNLMAIPTAFGSPSKWDAGRTSRLRTRSDEEFLAVAV